ncbi:DsbA family oxidoreductase [Pseudomonas fluorescens]|uniref:DSBA-like thioredoxin domain-containing protein n=1 Tax=Pseudomonas fluorescens TaxID=294 RepID=A0A5E7AUE3_PSEFL|nr:DsbA family oxidoreductase [Pseudomonas fluorescens]VVN80344.1 hypothetical protein PS723_01037 [Pseudomonas fluorescens]
MSRRLHIEVFFDFICPWCLIGKRQLERALAQLRSEQPDVVITLQWQGVQLLPNLPPEGEPFAEFYLKRLGSAENVRLRQAQVQQAAAAVGVNIDLSTIQRMPNTANAHRLLEHATAIGSPQQCEALLELLFAAYFHLGENLGCSNTLVDIGETCGFDRAALIDCLRADATPFVGQAASGVSSVPCFRLNRERMIAGAQAAEVLLGAMCEVLQHNVPQRQLS